MGSEVASLSVLGHLHCCMYQAETLKIPPSQSAIVLQYKIKCINLLNEMLSNKETAMSNEALAGVVYLMINEWYRGNPDGVQKHMRGLKEMVRMRGGLDDLGMSGFLRKVILWSVGTSLSFIT